MIDVYHVESIILGAGEDTGVRTHHLLYDIVLNGVDIEAKCCGTVEVGREMQIFNMISYKRNIVS